MIGGALVRYKYEIAGFHKSVSANITNQSINPEFWQNLKITYKLFENRS